jgi:predicted Fe-S protein YdhL (DUF1289 family)
MKTTPKTKAPTKFWKAAPHQWGPGRVPAFDEATRRSSCGRSIDEISGWEVIGDSFDCPSCMENLAARERRAERRSSPRRRQTRCGHSSRANRELDDALDADILREEPGLHADLEAWAQRQKLRERITET